MIREEVMRMTRNYAPMVERNRRVNKEKADRAIRIIASMVDDGEKVQICTLSRRCGLSRSFFYTNADAAAALKNARMVQADIPNPPRAAASTPAVVERLEQRLIEKEEEILRLQKEKEALQKKLTRSDLWLLKKL